MWPTEDLTQKELQCKKKGTSTTLHSREPVEQFNSHCSRGRRTAKNASLHIEMEKGAQCKLLVLSQARGGQRTGIFGNMFQWPFTLNFAIPAGCFVKVVRRNRGDVEDETLCQRETREPREAPPSRIEAITLSTGRPVADQSSG